MLIAALLAQWLGEADTVLEENGVVYLNEACLNELKHVANILKVNPIPITTLKPNFFDMPVCKLLMLRIRKQIDTGIGLAIIDRFPMEGLNGDMTKKLYWLFMSILGQPVPQKWDGTMLYDVRNEGG